MAWSHLETDVLPIVLSISSKHRSTGYVSLLILLLLTTLSGLGMEGYLKANAENRMVRRVAQSQQALYLAEGGIEWAKVHLPHDKSDIVEGLSKSLLLATGSIGIEIEPIEGGYKVTSKGHAGSAVRKIEQIIQFDNGKWVMKSYQELHN